ncbi:hypothetical protein FHG66_16070 [Rubellimicrobium rubrum]|uniref:Uncharacterized protein n=1 Tax=Rubellimicrobium rubrum TaxID=2585369 RepID=A0A5C4MTQ4_9RHOB|nr:hypothetical protein [Rubellimicrobium rubrum]TNC47730.1 hypothetical protein FHG66_16070 [Rubellimicrobium rubrum]
MSSRSLPTLSTILVLDAVACLAMGLGLASVAPAIAGFTDLPSAFVRAAGVVLLPIGVFILMVASRSEIRAWAVPLIVTGNLAWVLLSVSLPLAGLVQPNALGWAFLLGQALAVATLTALEHTQARRIGRRAQAV